MFEFVETPFFTRNVSRYLDDDELARLQSFLIEHPDTGQVVPGAGGVRKLRWAVAGRGKRGGLRVIPAHALRAIKEAIEDAQGDS